MNILEIKNFSKTYKGNKKAVDNLCITVEAGDIYGFIGHNGAGKSTTIKSVVGVLEFTEGEIYIDGHSVKKEPMECKDLLIKNIEEQMDIGENAYDFENEKSVVMVIGVNGVGKTTSIGKLAAQLKGNGKKVVMAAADTFRAAAADQLKEWARRSNVDIVAGNEGSDPGAVLFDAIASAKNKNADVLLCDTAGRLHNKKNLMEELKKLDRIIEKEYSGCIRENLIVLDATTGQNALVQAKTFMEATDITGVVLTKMDGTAKGGIAIAIQAELGIPVKYIGVGEGIDDLQKFNSHDFVSALFTK